MKEQSVATLTLIGAAKRVAAQMGSTEVRSEHLLIEMCNRVGQQGFTTCGHMLQKATQGHTEELIVDQLMRGSARGAEIARDAESMVMAGREMQDVLKAANRMVSEMALPEESEIEPEHLLLAMCEALWPKSRVRLLLFELGFSADEKGYGWILEARKVQRENAEVKEDGLFAEEPDKSELKSTSASTSAA